MQNWLHILADSDESLIRLAFFGVVVFIWIASAIANAAKKGVERQRQQLRKTRASMTQSPPARARVAPVSLAPEIARRVPPPVITRTATAKKLSAKQRSTMAMKAGAFRNSRPTAPPIPGKPPVLPAAQKPAPAAPANPAPMAVPNRKPATIGAVAIKGWLKPNTLKQQFILTELFQPPLALREERW